MQAQPTPQQPVTISPAQARFVSWVSELLVDIVVLNLFVEFVHTIVIDSFYISVLTAVLLKLMVDAVKLLEHAVSRALSAREGAGWRAARICAVWLILFLSKFVILEAVNVVFGDHVELGSFVEIAALIVTMLAANAVLLAVFRRLGAGRASDAT